MTYKDEYLSHHGINGMKWGIRRYQNEDGTRTPLGQKHRRELEGFKETVRNTASKAGKAIKSGASKAANFAKDNAETIAKVALAAAAVGATAYLISRNKGAIASVVKNAKNTTLSSLASAKSTINSGKNYVTSTLGKAKSGVNSGINAAKAGAKNTFNKASAGASKVKTRVSNFGNTPEIKSMREQASRVGGKAKKLVTDPAGREALKKAATPYAKGAADVAGRTLKTTAKAATIVGRGVEKGIDNLYQGKKPKFVKTKVAIGALAAYKLNKSAKERKERKEYKRFQQDQYKQWKNSKK